MGSADRLDISFAMTTELLNARSLIVELWLWRAMINRWRERKYANSCSDLFLSEMSKMLEKSTGHTLLVGELRSDQSPEI
jgi:hypothetical protein